MLGSVLGGEFLVVACKRIFHDGAMEQRVREYLVGVSVTHQCLDPVALRAACFAERDDLALEYIFLADKEGAFVHRNLEIGEEADAGLVNAPAGLAARILTEDTDHLEGDNRTVPGRSVPFRRVPRRILGNDR